MAAKATADFAPNSEQNRIAAPGFDEPAKAIFASKKNLRLLVTDALADPNVHLAYKSVAGGMLVQTRDVARTTAADLKEVQPIRPMLHTFCATTRPQIGLLLSSAVGSVTFV